MKKPLKKAKKGRPRGSDKEAVNVYMRKERASRLREFSVKEQKTISIVVENALEAYGI
jgi:hypothetical protein